MVATIALSVGPQDGHAGRCGKTRSQIATGPTTESIRRFANHPSPQSCSRDSDVIIANAKRNKGMRMPPVMAISDRLIWSFTLLGSGMRQSIAAALVHVSGGAPRVSNSSESHLLQSPSSPGDRVFVRSSVASRKSKRWAIGAMVERDPTAIERNR